MSSIVLSVIDTACDTADQSFFPPKITMSTKSTTQIATVLGFPEYPGFVSSPPKLYKTITWSGTSEHQLWYQNVQIGGAKFEYSGSSTIDTNGNYTSLYTKNFSAMCQATGGLVTSFIPGVPAGLENYVFSGWLGPAGHQKCPPPGIPYSPVGNEAVGKGELAIFDSSSLWGSKKPHPSFSNAQVSNFNAISATQGVCVDSGGATNLPTIIALFEPVPQGVVPTITNETAGIIWFFGCIVWDHNYSSILSNEYTDAEALANAKVIIGNGATAQNHPRTTGFTSTFTSVVYTLLAENLIPGTNYTVAVDIWNPSTGVTTPKQYSLAPLGNSQTIIDLIPTPPVGQSLQVRNPRIAFA